MNGTRSNRKLSVLALLFSLSTAVGAAPCDSLQSVRWILGDWKTEGGQTTTSESWGEVSPRTFEGRGEARTTDTNELRSSETLRLVEMSGELFYVAKVGHNEVPVAFKLTGCTEESAVFENPDHDFPRRLEYRRTGKNKMLVRVSDGGDKGFQVEFERHGEED